MEYSLNFSERLVDAADAIKSANETGDEAGRAILYLSLLACEVSLKALLEKAGFSVKELTKRSHDMSGLLTDLCACELSGTGIGNSKPFSASGLLSKEVVGGVGNGTVGALLNAKDKKISRYPSEIRYGQLVSHFPASVMLDCAKVVNSWARDHIEVIRRK